MEQKIVVTQEGAAARLADTIMLPVMYLVSGTFSEAPQMTHRWNNTKLTKEQIQYLDNEKMLHYNGVESAKPRHFLRFHIPIIGGWRDYVAMEPEEDVNRWYFGWITAGTRGVSRIPLSGPARALLGQGKTSFFAVTPEGKQLPLKELAYGKIGDDGAYKNSPLL